MTCTPCPLLVTAIQLPVLLTAMFNGKSPKPKDFPTGLSFQPLGRVIGAGIICALINKVKHNDILSKIVFFIVGRLFQ